MPTSRSLLPAILLLAVLARIQAPAAILYVHGQSLDPSLPYDTWETAAQTIQDAIDAARAADTVKVTNGIYATGGKALPRSMTNRVALTSNLRVESVNGPLVTVIKGGQVPGSINGESAVRCAYLSTNAVLSGFTLMGGATWTNDLAFNRNQAGGGVAAVSQFSTVSNCIIANNYGVTGGGAAHVGLVDCLVVSNAAVTGGGAYYCYIRSSTLESNSASLEGGGAFQTDLTDTILTNNAAGLDGGGAKNSTMVRCRLARNRARVGGGLYQGTAFDSSFLGNVANLSGGAAGFATIRRCILSGNSADEGGGSFRCIVTDCTISGNSAVRGGGNSSGGLDRCLISTNSAEYGGGSFFGTLANCALVGNTATNEGGGSYYSDLAACSILGNISQTGGGVFGGGLGNCIVYHNFAELAGSNHFDAGLAFSCTSPLPSGYGNIADDPGFVDGPAGFFQLSANSPCINSGQNIQAGGEADLVGQPRISGGTADMGAYEFQNPSTIISIAWLNQYQFAIDGSADLTDNDLDQYNNWSEWKCGTIPTDARSVLHLDAPIQSEADVVLRWQSVPGKTYWILRGDSLRPISSFDPLATGVTAQPDSGSTTFTNLNATAESWFYVVGVED